jgi:tetratricopeptide (TPR) repeat protein
MGYDLFIIVSLPLLWLAINAFSFICIFLYELAHAIPALIFTSKPVVVYIGTYGDNNTPKFKLGRLTVYIKLKYFYTKNNGLCLYDTNVRPDQQEIILIAAPLLMFLIAIVLLIITCSDDVNGIYVRILLASAFLMVLWNLAINLFPLKLPVKSSARLHYSDGYQLVLLMEDKRNYSNIVNACSLYDEQNYGAALVRLEKTKAKYMEESLFTLMISCCIYLKKFELIDQLQKKYATANWYELINADDYYFFGYANLQLKNYSGALINFDKAISLDPAHFNGYNNRAFVYNAIKEYQRAKDDAGKAIFINENLATAFSNRAYANFMLGKNGEAINDAAAALSLNKTDPYALLVTGMYLLHKGKTEEALTSFGQAKQIDPDMLYVNEYIALPKV